MCNRIDGITILKIVPSLIMMTILISACEINPENSPRNQQETLLLPSISTHTVKNTKLLSITHTSIPQNNSPTKTKIFTFTHTPPPEKRGKYDEVSGTYELRHSDGSGGNLWVLMESGNESQYIWIFVELYYSRGAPSYNQGYFMEKLILAWDMAVYHRYDVCNIVFEFSPYHIEVNQLATWNDCGFGGGVNVTGIYKLVDDKPPKLGCIYHMCNY